MGAKKGRLMCNEKTVMDFIKNVEYYKPLPTKTENSYIA